MNPFNTDDRLHYI